MAATMQTVERFDPKLLLQVLTALKKGDFSVRLPNDWTGLGGGRLRTP